MKKAREDGIRRDYRRDDLGSGVRGKYLDAYKSGNNLVLLSPDVAEIFPTDDSVNEALRAFIRAARTTTTKPRRVGKRVPANRR